MKSSRERWLAAFIVAAGLGSVAFIVVYATRSRLLEGLTLAFTAAAFCAAAVGWVAWILPQEQAIDERDEYPSDPQLRAAQREQVRRVETEVTRDTVLLRLLGGALTLFGLALVLPIKSLGIGPKKGIDRPKWAPGTRVVREDGTPLLAKDMNVNSVLTVFPEGALDDPESQTVLIRLPANSPAGVDGFVAYSKICTHAGCPVALYREKARQLMCPCHQSVFDVLDHGKVLSGPADRALPQLPLEIGADGYVRSAGNYPGPIGPGSWDSTT